MRHSILAGLAVSALATAADAQPLSQSMAQCSGLYGAMATHVTTAARKTALSNASAIWAEAALAQTTREGRADAENWINTHAGDMFSEWSEMNPALMVASDDFKDWTNYCKALARDRGIDITS